MHGCSPFYFPYQFPFLFHKFATFTSLQYMVDAANMRLGTNFTHYRELVIGVDEMGLNLMEVGKGEGWPLPSDRLFSSFPRILIFLCRFLPVPSSTAGDTLDTLSPFSCALPPWHLFTRLGGGWNKCNSLITTKFLLFAPPPPPPLLHIRSLLFEFILYMYLDTLPFYVSRKLAYLLASWVTMTQPNLTHSKWPPATSIR